MIEVTEVDLKKLNVLKKAGGIVWIAGEVGKEAEIEFGVDINIKLWFAEWNKGVIFLKKGKKGNIGELLDEIYFTLDVCELFGGAVNDLEQII